MIELNNIKAVRYTYEEMAKLKQKLKDKPYDDWFTPFVEKQYPDLTLVATMFDEVRASQWFLFAPYNYHVVSSVEIGDDGKPFVQERVVTDT